MSRIVLGSRGSVLALSQARAALADLTAEWPDVNITLRTVPARSDDAGVTDLLEAVTAGRVNIALVSLELLPVDLPQGLALAAVTRRQEPRLALVGRGVRDLAEVEPAAVVGVLSDRDASFLRAARADVEPTVLSGDMDEDFARLAAGEVAALVVPASCLIQPDRRQFIAALLDPAVLPPAAGQGSLGLLVRDDDHLAGELAYTLQHRPSFDRVVAERAFAAELLRRVETGDSLEVGSLASVSGDGELSLLGAVTSSAGAFLVTADTSGEASEGPELGKELAADVQQQLAKVAS